MKKTKLLKRDSFILIIFLTFYSCTSGNYRKEIKKEFSHKRDYSLKKKKIDQVMQLDQWALYESTIVCKNENGNPFFFAFNSYDFSFITSFGNKGQGPTDFISPQIVKKDKQFSVVDNGKNTLKKISFNKTSFQEKEQTDLAKGILFNEPVTYSDNLICYTDLTPNKLSLILYNIHTNSIVDRIDFHDENKKGESYKYNFKFDLYNNKLALAHEFFDQITVYNISDKGFKEQFTIIGNKVRDVNLETAEQTFYTDLQCDSSGFFAVTQEAFDTKLFNGFSRIERYEWSGKGEYKLETEIITHKILPISVSQLWLASPLEDDIFLISVQEQN